MGGPAHRPKRENVQTTSRPPLCPVCDEPVRFAGLVRARKWYYCLKCEVEFPLPSKTPAAGAGEGG